MTQEKSYSINKEKERLVFTTSSFKADKGSLLHKGIYNYELASSLAATAVCGIIYILIAFNYRVIFIHYLIVGVIFVSAFVGFRKFIFRERVLKVVFDRAKKFVKISSPSFINEKTEEIPFAGISSVEIGSKKILPENIDGIKFVQKISSQHGSPLPGLEDEVEFVTLSLKLTDGTERLIYAGRIEGKIDGEPEVPLNEIRDFLICLKEQTSRKSC